MTGLDITDRACAVVHQAEDLLASICAEFSSTSSGEPGEPVLQTAQSAVYYALGCWLDAPVIVSPLVDGLLTLARARAGHAAPLAALERARTRVGQAAFYLPRHPHEPTSEIDNW